MIVVMGIGRCGTTVMAQLLMALGFDSHGHLEIFRELPHEVLRAEGYEWPELVKGTGTLVVGLNRWIESGKWDVEVIILCTRELESAARSMSHWKRNSGTYKGLSREDYVARIHEEVSLGHVQAREQIAQSGKRCVEITFPRSILDKEYCYAAVCEAVGHIKRRQFNAAWKKVVKPSQSRFGG